MTVNMLTPDVNTFDPSASVKFWMESSARPRRPNLLDKCETYERPKSKAVTSEREGSSAQSDSAEDSERVIYQVMEDAETEVVPVQDEADDEPMEEAGNKDSDIESDDEGFDDVYASDDDFDNEMNETEVIKRLEMYSSECV